MVDKQAPRYVTPNESKKLHLYRQRLIAVLERDGTIDKFIGSTDYILRSAIEALGLQDIFFDAPPAPAADDAPPVKFLSTADWDKAKRHFDQVVGEYESLRGEPGVNVTIALTVVFAPLRKRYDAGERTAALYEEMMSVE